MTKKRKVSKSLEKPTMGKDEWKSTILKIRDYSEEQFDKLIVTINGGALAITMGFVKDIVTIANVRDTTLLKVSWLCFVLSLLFILVSHRTSIISMNLELKECERKSDQWDKVTKFSNWLSILILISGIISFMIFVAKSI